MARISVKLAQMQSLETIRITAGKTLENLLKTKQLDFNASVRVNGKVVARSYVLKAGDVVMVVGEVAGG